MPNQEQGLGVLQNWNKTQRQLLLNKVFKSDKDKVVKILFSIIKVNPKERLSADSCLERGYHNNLFRKTRDGYIVGINDTEVSTLENTTL